MTPTKGVFVLGAVGAALYLLRSKGFPPPSAPATVDPNAGPRYVPPSPSMPAPAPGPTGPRQLGGGFLPVTPGGNYRATVVTRAPLSWLANKDKVRSQAESKGFRNVVVSTSKPAGWPGSLVGDYYVSATYQGAPTSMERTYAGGQVNIVDAWQV